MNAEEFAEYLARLLGHSVVADQLVALSSGRQARAAGWLAERGFAPPDLRARLSNPFAPAALLGGATGGPAAATLALVRGRASDDGTGAPRVGVDIQRVDELIPADAAVDPKSSSELTAIFTIRELSYAQSRPVPSETLTGLFAAKEALRKCDAALAARPLIELEVLPDGEGKPGFPGFALSVSHSGGFAVAVAFAAVATHVPTVTRLPSVEVVAARSSRLALVFRVITLAGALVAFALALERFGVLGGRS